MANVMIKDPDAVVDYTIDWGTGYLASGETISTSTWSVTPTGGLTIGSDSKTTTTATVSVSAGTHGVLYTLMNHITTSNSNTDERTILVRVWEPL